MTRRVPRRAEHDHGAVAEYILVKGKRFDLALAFNPAIERLKVYAFGRLRTGNGIPVALTNQQRRPRKTSPCIKSRLVR